MRHKLHTLAIVGLMVFSPSGALGQNDKLARAFAQSYSLEARKDYSNAIALLTAANAHPTYESNLRLGWLCYLGQRYPESLTYYQKAIELMPRSIEPRLGYVLPASALNRWTDVTVQYNKILEIDPRNSLVNYRMGLISYNKKDYSNAHQYLEKVINLYPFDYDSLLLFAWCNYHMGKSREAQILFNKVLLRSPNDRSALQGLSLLK